mmetsp:Transcript_40529/g.87783  ORF Transcript_40529/g.87783 Transcript_40529/m.87783 type:complete len:394 (+) Transcript_40529:220-1401(+)
MTPRQVGCRCWRLPRAGIHEAFHLLLGGCHSLTFGLHPLVGSHRVRLPGEMRIWALSRIGVMKPLCEQTSMQRHHAIMVRGNFFQSLCQLRGGLSGRLRGTWQLGDQLQQLLRRGLRRSHLTFQMPHERLAFVDAADRVDARGSNAVGLRIHVVWNQHCQILGIRRVQRSQLLQVVHRFGELPVATQGGTIEVLQEHPAGARPLVLRQETFQVAALGILPMAIALTDLLHNLGGHVKREVLACIFSSLGEDIPPHVLSELARVVPAGVGLHHSFALLGDRGGVHVRSHQENGHVGVDQHLEIHLVHRVVQGNAVRLVNHAQATQSLVVNEVFQGGRQDCEFMKSKTLPLQSILKERQNEGRHVIFQNLFGGALVPTHPRGLQALDVHRVTLHK